MKRFRRAFALMAVSISMVAAMAADASASAAPITDPASQFYRISERIRVEGTDSGAITIKSREAFWELVDINIGVLQWGTLPTGSGTSANAGGGSDGVGDCHDRGDHANWVDDYQPVVLGNAINDFFGPENVYTSYRYWPFKQMNATTANGIPQDWTLVCSEGGSSAMGGGWRLKRTGTSVTTDFDSVNAAVIRGRDWGHSVDSDGKYIQVGFNVGGSIKSGPGAATAGIEVGTSFTVKPPSTTHGGEGTQPWADGYRGIAGDVNDQIWDEWRAGCGWLGACGVDGEWRGAAATALWQHVARDRALPPMAFETYVEVTCARWMGDCDLNRQPVAPAHA